MWITEYTVKDHLYSIFDTVGVRGQEALIERLFLDNLYPTPVPARASSKPWSLTARARRHLPLSCERARPEG